jgi:hypothetical protein
VRLGGRRPQLERRGREGRGAGGVGAWVGVTGSTRAIGTWSVIAGRTRRLRPSTSCTPAVDRLAAPEVHVASLPGVRGQCRCCSACAVDEGVPGTSRARRRHTGISVGQVLPVLAARRRWPPTSRHAVEASRLLLRGASCQRTEPPNVAWGRRTWRARPSGAAGRAGARSCRRARRWPRGGSCRLGARRLMTLTAARRCWRSRLRWTCPSCRSCALVRAVQVRSRCQPSWTTKTTLQTRGEARRGQPCEAMHDGRCTARRRTAT